MTLSQETCLKAARSLYSQRTLGLDDGKVRGSLAADFLFFVQHAHGSLMF